MRKTKTLDFARLLGFDTVSDQISGSLDFREGTIGDKLGARVGPETGNIFREEALAARLGVKRGGDIEPTDPA